MKKTTIIFTLLCLITFAASAQTFDILDEEQNVISGQTVVVPVTVGGEIDISIIVRNNTETQISSRLSKSLIETTGEIPFNTFCCPITVLSPGGSCSTNNQTAIFILSPNETSGEAHIHYEHGAISGVSTIQYKIFEEGNTSNYQFVNISFSTLTSVNTSLASEFIVSPNPAINTFNIHHNYGPKAVVEIFNVLGKSVAKINSGAENTFSIDCTKWGNGYYFCRLYNDGKIEKTLKLVVSH